MFFRQCCFFLFVWVGLPSLSEQNSGNSGGTGWSIFDPRWYPEFASHTCLELMIVHWSTANNASNHWPTKFRAPDPLTDSLRFRLYVTSSKKLRTWNDATVQLCSTPCSELTLIGSGKVFPIYSTYLTVQGKQIRPWWPLPYNAMWQLWISQLRHGFVSDAEFSGRYSTAQRLTFWYAQTCAYTCHVSSIKSKQKTYCSFCTYHIPTYITYTLYCIYI